MITKILKSDPETTQYLRILLQRFYRPFVVIELQYYVWDILPYHSLF